MRATKENILSYLQELKSELTHKGIQKLALFGSYAKDEPTVYSDIDIAIQKDKTFLLQHSSYSYFELISYIKEKISARFHKNIDVFDLDSKAVLNNPLKKS